MTCQNSYFLASYEDELNVSAPLTLGRVSPYLNGSQLVIHQNGEIKLGTSIVRFL